MINNNSQACIPKYTPTDIAARTNTPTTTIAIHFLEHTMQEVFCISKSSCSASFFVFYAIILIFCDSGNNFYCIASEFFTSWDILDFIIVEVSSTYVIALATLSVTFIERWRYWKLFWKFGSNYFWRTPPVLPPELLYWIDYRFAKLFRAYSFSSRFISLYRTSSLPTFILLLL